MKFGLFLAFYISSTFAIAGVISTDEDQEVHSAKHELLLDSSPSSPPLESDDPGTPGPNGIEINVYSNLDSFKVGNSLSSVIDANYGLGDQIQIRLSKEALHEKIDGQTEFYGYGQTSLAIKWRFYDNSTNSFKLAVYPSYQFADETKQIDVDSEGRSLYIPIILSKTSGRYTFLLNAGISTNLDFASKKSNFISLALGRASSETFRLMSEVVSQKSNVGQRVDLRFGFVKEIFPNEESKYETGFFGSVGRNIGWTDDGYEHLNILIGFAFAVKPIDSQH